MALAKSEFKNNRNHFIGVVQKFGKHQEMKGVAVAPGDNVWLDEDEQIETANAPRYDEDNPFTNGDLTLVTPATMVSNRRPLGDTQLPQPAEASAAPPPAKEDGLGGDGETEEETAPAGSSEKSDDELAAEAAQAEKDRIERAKQEQAATPANRPEHGQSKAEAEESARNAAARAVKAPTGAPAVKPPKAPAKAPEGSRASAEEVATPEAVGS